MSESMNEPSSQQLAVADGATVADRLAIRERIEAYSDAVFRQDGDAWIANWCDDAEWDLPELDIKVEGKAQIRAAWEQAKPAYRLTAFYAFPGPIEIRGDQAAVRVHTHEILVDQAGAVRQIVGAYDDALEKRAGRWLFRRRRYRMLHGKA